jgi:uncharacterized membrane protein
VPASEIAPSAGTSGKARRAPPGVPRTAPSPPAQERAAVASAPAPRRSKAVKQFACQGNEPFWAFAIADDVGRYVSMSKSGEPERLEIGGKLRVTGEGRTPDVDWRGKSAAGGTYRAWIQQQSCADTLSDADGQAGYRIELTLPGGEVLKGCCRTPAEAAAKPPPAEEQDVRSAPVADLRVRPLADWSRFLPELLPAIDACVEKTPGAERYVTKAWPMNRGMVGVRLRNGVAGWFDCVAQYDGKVVERFEAVTADTGPVPGEGAVLYTPAGQSVLSGKCWYHERVMDAAGVQQIGWLSSNRC